VTVVVCAGDSITEAGFYVHRMAEAGPAGWEWHVRGRSGWTAVALAEAWDELVLALAPDVVTFLAGVNDAYFEVAGETADGLPGFAAACESVVDRTRAAGAAVVLIQPFLVLDRSTCREPWHRPLGAVLPRYRAAMAAVAQRAGVRCVDTQAAFDRFLAGRPASLVADEPVHVRPEGHDVIASAVLPEVLDSAPSGCGIPRGWAGAESGC
jgi:lysophospholipase L1-like esterase